MRWVYNLYYFLIWPFMCLYHPPFHKGSENIPEGGALLCANHSSYSDPVLIGRAAGIKHYLRFIAKLELFRFPVFGWLLKQCGVLSIDRQSADIAAIKASMRILKGGQKLVIFPEGHRIKDPAAQALNNQAKNGAVMLAVKTGVPLVPVYVSPIKKPFRRVKVVIGQPYYPSIEGKKANSDEYERLSMELMDKINELGSEKA